MAAPKDKDIKALIQGSGGTIDLDPQKAEAFHKIVEEKYQGNLNAAVKRAIEYFIMYESSPGLKNVSDTLNEIKGKISDLKSMNSDLTTVLRTLNEKAERIRKLRENQEKMLGNDQKDQPKSYRSYFPPLCNRLITGLINYNLPNTPKADTSRKPTALRSQYRPNIYPRASKANGHFQRRSIFYLPEMSAPASTGLNPTKAGIFTQARA